MIRLIVKMDKLSQSDIDKVMFFAYLLSEVKEFEENKKDLSDQEKLEDLYGKALIIDKTSKELHEISLKTGVTFMDQDKKAIKALNRIKLLLNNLNAH